MRAKIRLGGVVSGALAFCFCMAAGVYLLATGEKDPLPVALGLYFIGKALFVGPMLVLAALQTETRP